METQSAVLAEPEIMRARYFEELERYLEDLKTGCREFKTEYRRVVTDEDYEQVVSRFLVERSRKK
jgi:hypothetical protein